jgi:hypothetical protein
VDGHLVGDGRELRRESLHAFNEERDVRKPRALGAPGAGGERVRACVDGDRERIRICPRAMEGVAAVTRTDVDDDATVCGGYSSDLTDVDVDETLADESTHAAMVPPSHSPPA